MTTMAGRGASPLYVTFTEDIFDTLNLVFNKVLGKGMSGHAILAQSTDYPETLVAMKVIEVVDKSCYTKMKELFDREAKIMQKLKHPHLMKGYLAVECPNRLCITMDYCPHGTLADKLGNLTFQTIELYLVQLASAVKYMHDTKIAHCDIKLANILVKSQYKVILADFGLSLEWSNDSSTALLRKIGGTKAYLSPERNSEELDKEIDLVKMDVYALGVSLWGMVFATNPEMGKYDYLDYAGLKDDSKNDSNEIKPKLLKSCLQKMLQEDASNRYDSSDLLEELKRQSIWKALAESLPMKVIVTSHVDLEDESVRGDNINKPSLLAESLPMKANSSSQLAIEHDGVRGDNINKPPLFAEPLPMKVNSALDLTLKPESVKGDNINKPPLLAESLPIIVDSALDLTLKPENVRGDTINKPPLLAESLPIMVDSAFDLTLKPESVSGGNINKPPLLADSLPLKVNSDLKVIIRPESARRDDRNQHRLDWASPERSDCPSRFFLPSRVSRGQGSGDASLLYH